MAEKQTEKGEKSAVIKIAFLAAILVIAMGVIGYDYVKHSDVFAPSVESEQDVEGTVKVENRYNAKPAPELRFTDVDGNDFTLQELETPAILLHFWATWCAPCLVEFPLLIDLLNEFDGKVKMVAVSMDYKEERLKSFMDEHAPQTDHIIWVHDQDSSIAYDEFLISQIPETILIGPGRLMQDKIIGEFDWAKKSIRTRLTSLANGVYER